MFFTLCTYVATFCPPIRCVADTFRCPCIRFVSMRFVHAPFHSFPESQFWIIYWVAICNHFQLKHFNHFLPTNSIHVTVFLTISPNHGFTIVHQYPLKYFPHNYFFHFLRRHFNNSFFVISTSSCICQCFSSRSPISTVHAEPFTTITTILNDLAKPVSNFQPVY